MENTIRIGEVSSVNAQKRTARVYFTTLGYTSGEIKVLINQPFITVKRKESGANWKHEAKYATCERSTDLANVGFKKDTPDIIKTSYQSSEEEIKIEPWLPYIGQMVICIYDEAGTGYIVGGV